VSKDAVKSPDTAPSDGAAPATDTARSRPPGTAPVERIARWTLLALAFSAGGAVGILGSFGHRTSDTWLGVNWPLGLALCFAGLIGLLVGISELLTAGLADSWRPTRLSALGVASAGWLFALLWLTYLGPPPTFARKGDVVLANDWKSLLYLVGGMLVITVVVYRAWVATLAARLGSRSGATGKRPL
jgi:hypothetical protein